MAVGIVEGRVSRGGCQGPSGSKPSVAGIVQYCRSGRPTVDDPLSRLGVELYQLWTPTLQVLVLDRFFRVVLEVDVGPPGELVGTRRQSCKARTVVCCIVHLVVDKDELIPVLGRPVLLDPLAAETSA